MDYIPEIFKRLELEQLCSFLNNGSELAAANGDDYKQRINAAEARLIKFLKKTIRDSKTYDKAESEIMLYASDCESVYMEIGVKCGAILMKNLLEKP